MKRCPKCSFLYLDTDEVCDLDGTPLVQMNDAELAGSLTPASTPVLSEKHERPGSRKPLVFTALGGLLLGIILFAAYFSVTRRTAATVSQQPIAQVTAPSPQQTLPNSTVTPSPTPEASPSPSERAAPSPTPRLTRANVSNNPVSTTASQNNTQGHAVIRLTNGASIEADEVWRTKEGVWYRRNGMVTLVKANRVKSIEKGSRK